MMWCSILRRGLTYLDHHHHLGNSASRVERGGRGQGGQEGTRGEDEVPVDEVWFAWGVAALWDGVKAANAKDD
jgi:hypothetical protein